MRTIHRITCAALAACLLVLPLSGQVARRQRGKTPQAGSAAGRSPLAKRLRAIDALLAKGDTEAALDQIEALVEQFPENPEVLFKSYEVYLATGQLKEAEQDLAVAVGFTASEAVKAERQLKLDELRGRLAETERQKKEAAEKAAAAAARAQAEADDKAARLNFIQNRVADGNREAAAEGLGKLTAQYPADAELLFKASELAARLEMFDEAERWLASSIDQTTDASAKSQRRAQVLELQYKRKQAEEVRRRQDLAVTFKKLALQAGDGKEQEVTRAIDSLIQANPQDADVHFMAHDAFLALGDYVAAEFHLNKAVELARDAKTKNERQLLFIDLNYKREKAAETLVANVEKFIADMNYPEASKAIRNMDNIVLYHQRGYVLRGGLLGLYRRYEDAVKIYNRVLEDPKLAPDLRAEVTALRDYCVRKATPGVTGGAARAGMKHCHFCHAELPGRAAYCEQCLAFQHPISVVRWKNTRVNFAWHEGRVARVNYHFENRHTGRNLFSVLSGVAGAAAVGAGATPTGPVGMSLQEAEVVDRNFDFKYEEGAPQGVRFSSAANGGEITTMELQGATTTDPVWVVNETGGGKAAFKLEDILVYPNNPKVDPVFGQMAFRQNMSRGFAANWNFDPSMWSEPHIFVFYYDAAGRATRAVEALTYSDQSTPAGHMVSNGRKQFTGPGRLDPLQDPLYREINYNGEGLVASITAMNAGKETYRREMTYGPQGIVQERELVGGKVVATWRYTWQGGKLATALIDNKAWKDQTIIFQ